MKLSFRDLAPGAEPWLESLAQVPMLRWAGETAWAFAAIEAAHLLFLAILGGAVLALNLRLFGLVLVSETPAEVERRTRPWLHAGVVGALTTGVVMSLMNARTLYPSGAFFVKMVALIAAILFSYAVVREVVRAPSGRSRTAPVLAAAALALWAFAGFVFATTPGVNGGMALVILAGAPLLFATVRRKPGAAPPPVRLAAFASTLAWVTVAAAGRWIGFS